ncbi:MAG: dUTP diphosphatase [Candidatus Aminicenantes bacterium]|nr:MAG: dUTP diphosphatase [Candidatus Aminicenantes bacterium]
MELKIKKIHKDAKLPHYGHKGDAGLDIFSTIDCVLRKREVKAIPTGIKVAIPEGYVGLIWDKSGVSLEGVHRLAGVVDSGYRGEVKIVMANLSDEPFSIEKGMKIAQLLIQPVVEVEVIEVEDLEATPRGENGFGSTGKY